MVPFALDLHQTKKSVISPHKFDVDRFNADFAYTMDGSQYGELQYESFNAAEAVITCHSVMFTLVQLKCNGKRNTF